MGKRMPEQPERLALSVAEAAAAISISERHLRSMLPEIPHFRIGGRVVIPIELFQEWLRKQAKAEPGRVEAIVGEVLESVSCD